MDVMPRQRPPHLQRQVTQHGRVTWYVRVGKGPRIRLQSPWGTPGFDAEYHAALDGHAPALTRGRASTGSLTWLWDRYRETTAWGSDLKPATRRQRENIMRHVLVTAGDKPYAAIKRAAVTAGRDRRATTPDQARHYLDTLRGLFKWALEAGHVMVDPTAGVTNPKRSKGAGFPVWTEDDLRAYEARWPIGTRQRVWLDVLLYTGARRGDAVRLGRQHIRDGIATFTTEKSGHSVTVTLPILTVLQKTLDAGPCGDLALVCGERGHPLTKESFGNMFGEAARQAGVAKNCHGLRKAAATRCAYNGANNQEMNAIFGWSGTTMAALYTEAADRKRLSIGAMHKMVDGTASEQATPSPTRKVRAGRLKAE
jgi:integrase